MKAMIVDDHPIIRMGVRMLLQEEKFDIVAETGDGAEAVQMVREHGPQLLVLDIAMPMLDGLEVLTRIGTYGLTTKVLIFTSQEPSFFARRCMQAGAAGYVCKTGDFAELRRAVRAIMSGYPFFPELPTSSVCRTDTEKSERLMIENLSNRELAILQQLARGFSNKEIGDAMLLSNKTVSTYKTRLAEKLDVRSVVYLADFAKRNNLI